VTNPVFTLFRGRHCDFAAAAAGGVTTDGNSGNLELNIALANTTAAPQKININTAKSGCWTPAGIGTQKPSHHRLPHEKRFLRNIDELTKVKGISASVLAKIRPLITVGNKIVLIYLSGAWITGFCWARNSACPGLAGVVGTAAAVYFCLPAA